MLFYFCSILTSSQALGQTPLKANQSSKKYDFKSPVKALVDNKNERQKKTRAQSSLESKFNDQPTDLRVKRIEENPEFQNLTKRFSQPKPSLKLNEASNNGFGDTPKNKNNRKSLDLNKSSNNTPKNTKRRSLDLRDSKSPSQLTIGDFIQTRSYV